MTSPRTLRRLQAGGVSYLHLVEEAERELALAAIAESTHQPGRDIAARLGYADAPAFHRAVKRRTGRSLTEYREGLGSS